MSKVNYKDIYDPELLMEGIAILLTYTLFAPLRLLVWLAKRGK